MCYKIPLSVCVSVMVSEWSEWTSCSPCIPQSSSLSGGMGLGLVSVQRRFRACLDVESGLPVGGREGECEEELEEERLCPQPDVCAGGSYVVQTCFLFTPKRVSDLCHDCGHQMCVTGARGAFGASVKTPAAVASVSASDDP